MHVILSFKEEQGNRHKHAWVCEGEGERGGEREREGGDDQWKCVKKSSSPADVKSFKRENVIWRRLY